MAKRFGRNQRRALLARVASLESDLLLGLERAASDDIDLSGVRYERKVLSIEDETDYNRDVRTVTCSLTVRATRTEEEAIHGGYERCEYFNIDGRRFMLSRVEMEHESFDAYKGRHSAHFNAGGRWRLEFNGVGPRRWKVT